MGIVEKNKVVGKSIYKFFADFSSITRKFEMVFEDGISIESVDIISNVKNCGYRRYFQSEVFRISANEAVYIADDVTDNVMLYYKNLIERDRLATLIEAVDVGIAIVNFSGKIIFSNSKLLRIFEVDGFEVKRLKDLFLNERSASEMEKYFEGVKDGKISCVGCVLEIETFKNNRKWVEITATVDNINNEPVIILSIKDITYKYLKEKEIEYISLHDDLTGLYNRRFFREELKRLFNERSYPLALVVFDINGLKMVNDVLGHKWGDWLIRKVADILKSSVRSVDLLARIGGDEFVLLMVNTDEEGVERCVSRIKGNLEKENGKENQPYISISIGYAIQNGQFENPDKLFAEADRSMYNEKYSEKRNKELKKIWESILKMKPEGAKLHKLEDFLKR